MRERGRRLSPEGGSSLPNVFQSSRISHSTHNETLSYHVLTCCRSAGSNRATRQKAYVRPRDRIKLFNIHPGDRVRLLVGKDQDKFIDEEKKAAGGWKLYTVKRTEPQRSRVYLEGLAVRQSPHLNQCIAPESSHFRIVLKLLITGGDRIKDQLNLDQDRSITMR